MERKREEEARKAADAKKPAAPATAGASSPKPVAPAKPAAPSPAASKKAPIKPKDQRLKELLQLYLTDKITPREYHQQRAKILAEP